MMTKNTISVACIVTSILYVPGRIAPSGLTSVWLGSIARKWPSTGTGSRPNIAPTGSATMPLSVSRLSHQ